MSYFNLRKYHVHDPLPKPILDGVERSYSISMLWDGTAAVPNIPQERQLLNLVLPPWQREFVWTEAQQRSFLEGIFLGIKHRLLRHQRPRLRGR